MIDRSVAAAKRRIQTVVMTKLTFSISLNIELSICHVVSNMECDSLACTIAVSVSVCVCVCVWVCSESFPGAGER